MYFKKCISLALTGLILLGCNGNAATTITHTKINTCVELEENDNAAFSRLQCENIGAYGLNITHQSPQYFTVMLNKKGLVATSELETYTHELPMEPGQVIEWHVVDGVPRFMVFRVKTQLDNGAPVELLTLNLVNKNRICPLASIDVKKLPKANEKIRELVVEKWSANPTCPTSPTAY